MNERSPPRDLIIVGAGPAGLAVAIAAHQAGLDYEVVEKGVLVNGIFRFPRHMTFFTTPDLLEIGGMPFVTPYEKPTQAEALKYYRRVTDAYGLRIALGERVVELERMRTRNGARLRLRTRSERGGERMRHTRNVVVATGYYDNPNLLGIPGEDLPHVSHYYTEPHPYFRKPVVVVGGKNSAAIAALELYRSGAAVTLMYRGPQLAESVKYWIRPDIINRIREGAISALFNTCVVEIRTEAVVVERRGRREDIPADAVFLLTGYHPDPTLLRASGVRVDEATLVPEHDPQTLETNVPGLYVAGALVSGRQTSRIFIENGRFHGEAIVASIRSRQA